MALKLEVFCSCRLKLVRPDCSLISTCTRKRVNLEYACFGALPGVLVSFVQCFGARLENLTCWPLLADLDILCDVLRVRLQKRLESHCEFATRNHASQR